MCASHCIISHINIVPCVCEFYDGKTHSAHMYWLLYLDKNQFC